jgi:hypothetical protein
MVFTCALLLSPITFTTHLVPLLYVFAAVLVMPVRRLGLGARVLAGVIGFGMLLCGISGRDIVGDAVYRAVGGYSLCAWTLLALFGITLVWSGRTTPRRLGATRSVDAGGPR